MSESSHTWELHCYTSALRGNSFAALCRCGWESARFPSPDEAGKSHKDHVARAPMVPATELEDRQLTEIDPIAADWDTHD